MLNSQFLSYILLDYCIESFIRDIYCEQNFVDFDSIPSHTLERMKTDYITHILIGLYNGASPVVIEEVGVNLAHKFSTIINHFVLTHNAEKN